MAAGIGCWRWLFSLMHGVVNWWLCWRWWCCKQLVRALVRAANSKAGNVCLGKCRPVAYVFVFLTLHIFGIVMGVANGYWV